MPDFATGYITGIAVSNANHQGTDNKSARLYCDIEICKTLETNKEVRECIEQARATYKQALATENAACLGFLIIIVLVIAFFIIKDKFYD